MFGYVLGSSVWLDRKFLILLLCFNLQYVSACIWMKINRHLNPQSSLLFFFFDAKTCLILFPWCIYHLKTLTFQIQNDTFRKKNASVVAFFRLSALQSCAISTSFFSIYFCIYRLTRKELALCWLFFQLPDCVSALNERVRFVEMNGKLHFQKRLLLSKTDFVLCQPMA